MHFYVKEKHGSKFEIKTEHLLSWVWNTCSVAGALDWQLKIGPQHSGTQPLRKCSVKGLWRQVWTSVRKDGLHKKQGKAKKPKRRGGEGGGQGESWKVMYLFAFHTEQVSCGFQHPAASRNRIDMHVPAKQNTAGELILGLPALAMSL